MDMKKILANFDSAVKGQHKAVEGVNDMKRFVSIIAENTNPYAPVEETVVNSFEADTVGGDANEFLLAADKINDEVMAQVNKIKINADESLLRDMMDKFNAFMTAYHTVGKEIIQPDMFNDSMREGAIPPRPTPQNQERGEKAQAKKKADNKEQFLKKKEKKQSKTEGLSFKEYAALAEAKKKMKGEDPCWSGYQMVGTKKKGGKEVPNCVPKK